MSKYLIKLKALNTFFFGYTHKYRKKKDKNEYVADYFQRSADFPQQTALLGMLRYYILQNNGQIPIKDTNKAAELVGEKSFSVNEEKPNFGKIKKISPVFILNYKNEFLFTNPKDLIIKNKKTEYLNPVESAEIKTSGNFTFFDNYIEKDGLSNFLTNSDSKFIDLKYDKDDAKNGALIEQEKIGITKPDNGETNENAYYKQIVYKFNTGYCFAFFADIYDEKLNNSSGYVHLGADKSPFRISFELLGEQNADFEKIICRKLEFEKRPLLKVILLSDAYLSKKAACKFSISDTVTFRFLETQNSDKKKYYSSDPLKNKSGDIKHSKKYNLYEKGSVFFFDNEEQVNDFKDELNKHIEFKQIGYNYFKIIK